VTTTLSGSGRRVCIRTRTDREKCHVRKRVISRLCKNDEIPCDLSAKSKKREEEDHIDQMVGEGEKAHNTGSIEWSLERPRGRLRICDPHGVLKGRGTAMRSVYVRKVSREGKKRKGKVVHVRQPSATRRGKGTTASRGPPEISQRGELGFRLSRERNEVVSFKGWHRGTEEYTNPRQGKRPKHSPYHRSRRFLGSNHRHAKGRRGWARKEAPVDRRERKWERTIG